MHTIIETVVELSKSSRSEEEEEGAASLLKGFFRLFVKWS